MNDFQKALNKAVRMFEGMRPGEMDRILDDPDNPLVDRSLLLCGMNEMYLRLTWRSIYGNRFYEISSCGLNFPQVICQNTFHKDKRREVIQWIMEFMKELLNESIVMESFGYGQVSFNTYKRIADDFSIVMERLFDDRLPVFDATLISLPSSPLDNVNETYEFLLTMEEAVIQFESIHVGLMKLYTMNETLRDRVIGGVQ